MLVLLKGNVILKMKEKKEDTGKEGRRITK